MVTRYYVLAEVHTFMLFLVSNTMGVYRYRVVTTVPEVQAYNLPNFSFHEWAKEPMVGGRRLFFIKQVVVVAFVNILVVLTTNSVSFVHQGVV